MKLTDEILLRYADDQLDQSTRDRVEQLLQDDQLAVDRLRLMRIGGEALSQISGADVFPQLPLATVRQIRDGVENEAKDNQRSAKPTNRFIAAAAAAAIVCFVLGGWISSLLPFDPSRNSAGLPVWIVRVVDYHTLYSRETVSFAKSPTAPARVALRRRLSDALGREVQIPDLSSHGLDFRRGQILDFQGEAVIQLVYLPRGKGKPIALCLKQAAGSDSGQSHSIFRNLGVIHWTRKGQAFVLVGHATESLLRSSARAIISQAI